VIKLALVVVADLEDYGIEAIADPADGAILLGRVGTLIKVVRM
jgi:hypothetical protein